MGKVEGVDDEAMKLLAQAEAEGLTKAAVVAKGVVKVIATDPLPPRPKAPRKKKN